MKTMTEQTYPPNVDIEFTHYWSDDDEAVMRERVQDVLTHFPEFEGEKLTIGFTQSAGIAGVTPKQEREDRNYIRLKAGASKFTIAHELYHILTREKAVDIFALSRSPYLIDKVPSYLNVPDCVENYPKVYAETLHEVASAAVKRFSNQQEMVKWFEKALKEEVDI